jgi:hypothetical protein
MTLGGIQMDPLWRTALWQQFGATIDMLENALLACPSTHWNGRLWSDHTDHPQPPESAAFWYITYHSLFWLDVYLTGSLEGFAPPAPFTLAELDPAGVLPERPYSREELHAYLVRVSGHSHLCISRMELEVIFSSEGTYRPSFVKGSALVHHRDMQARPSRWSPHKDSILFEPALEIEHNCPLQTHHGVNHLGLDCGPGFAVQLTETWAGNRPGNGMVWPGMF